jgi:hypothetical protein
VRPIVEYRRAYGGADLGAGLVCDAFTTSASLSSGIDAADIKITTITITITITITPSTSCTHITFIAPIISTPTITSQNAADSVTTVITAGNANG